MATGIAVIYEDRDVVVVDKPAGLPTVPAPDGPADRCVRAEAERQVGARLWVVHRLDRDTSGVLLFARSPEAHRRLCQAFETRAVRKTYVAFALGAPVPREGRIDTPLHQARRGKVRPARPGETGAWSASTRYVVHRQWTSAQAVVALVEARPETGRHHQIRAHLRSVGTPVLFDPLYGLRSDALRDAPVSRLALHASRLAWPDSGSLDEARAAEAPLPADLVALRRWLDKEWTAVR